MAAALLGARSGAGGNATRRVFGNVVRPKVVVAPASRTALDPGERARAEAGGAAQPNAPLLGHGGVVSGDAGVEDAPGLVAGNVGVNEAAHGGRGEAAIVGVGVRRGGCEGREVEEKKEEEMRSMGSIELDHVQPSR